MIDAIVLRDRYVLGWPRDDGQEPGTAVAKAPAGAILTHAFPSDAHMVGYVADFTKRINVGDWGPAFAAEIPRANLRMVLAVFDVDHPDHATPGFVAPDCWWEVETKKLAKLLEAHPAGFIYRTRGGYRVVYALPEPFAVRVERDQASWKATYESWLRYLRRRFGIVGDAACSDCSRLYRCPRVVRDGVAEERETIGDPHAIGTWAPVLAAEDTIEPEAARTSATGSYAAIPVSLEMPEAYVLYRVESFGRYLENTAKAVCFKTSGQTPNRRTGMLGICAVALWKFRLPMGIAGDVIDVVYNERLRRMGLAPWNRSEPGDFGISIDERLHAASEPSSKTPAPADDIMTLEEWGLWQDLLKRPAEVLTENELDTLRKLVADAPKDAARTELGNVLAAVGCLGARSPDGARAVTCPRGHAARVSAGGRFRCSAPTCGLKTKADVLRAIVEMAHVQ